MICRISILNDSKLSVARWTSCITLNSLYKVLSFADVQAFSIPTFWLALVHNSLIWPAKLRFSSMYTPSYFICSAFLTSWLSMFKVLSSFSASIFLGLTVRDWNFSSTKTTLSGPVFWTLIPPIKFVEASPLSNLVLRALFLGFGKAAWGRGCPLTTLATAVAWEFEFEKCKECDRKQLNVITRR